MGRGDEQRGGDLGADAELVEQLRRRLSGDDGDRLIDGVIIPALRGG